MFRLGGPVPFGGGFRPREEKVGLWEYEDTGVATDAPGEDAREEGDIERSTKDAVDDSRSLEGILDCDLRDYGNVLRITTKEPRGLRTLP